MILLASNTQPKLFCDFEDADLCHWTHDLNHDMDWSRESHKTPTGYSMPTGPSFDHTKGNGSDGKLILLLFFCYNNNFNCFDAVKR